MAQHVETAVTFTNRRGDRLFAILHAPVAGARRDLAIVLLSPGVKMRVGPQGLYRRMAASFAQQGYLVFRFDFFGLGDSEGELTETHLKDLYSHVESGRYVDDTLDAMTWVQEQYGASRFILSGLCGGAMTGLLAGARDERVAGLLALSITPVLSSRAAESGSHFSTGELSHLRKGYLRKVLSPRAWLRLLSFESDYKVIARSLFAALARKGPSTTPPPASDPTAVQDNSNPLFPPAFFRMLESKRPMCLVYGGTDRLRWDFEEKFQARHRTQLDRHVGGYEVHVIDQANHVLTFTEWQQQMLHISEGWLRLRFPPA